MLRFNNPRSNNFNRVLRRNSNQNTPSVQKRREYPDLASNASYTNNYIRGKLTRQKNNKSFKIHSVSKDVVLEKTTFWTFEESKPTGGEKVNYTFTFTGKIDISNFGDGTGQADITSGQIINKIYN